MSLHGIGGVCPLPVAGKHAWAFEGCGLFAACVKQCQLVSFDLEQSFPCGFRNLGCSQLGCVEPKCCQLGGHFRFP